MSSDNEPASRTATAGLLQYQSANSYVPAGATMPGAVALVMLGGLAAAAIGAVLGAVYLWQKLPFAIAVPVGQGLVVGFVLVRICKRAKLANKAVAITIGVVCGLAAAVFFYYAIYLLVVLQFRGQAAEVAGKFAAVGSAKHAQYYSFVHDHPFEAFDQFISIPRAHRGGFAGFLLTRPSDAWAFAIIQVIAVPLIAARWAGKSALVPFCSSCRRWFEGPMNISVLPLSCADALVSTVESSDPMRAAELAAMEDEPLGAGCSVARLYACNGCGEQFVDVIVVIAGRRAVKLPFTRALPDLVQALKGGPKAVAPRSGSGTIAAAPAPGDEPAPSSGSGDQWHAAPEPAWGEALPGAQSVPPPLSYASLQFARERPVAKWATPLAIIGAALCWLPIVGLTCAIIALWLARGARRNTVHWVAMIGLVFGAAITLAVVLTALIGNR